MERLRRRFPHALVLGFAPDGAPDHPVVSEPARGHTDHDVALDFVASMRGAPASPDESALLLEACDACREDPDADMLVTAPVGGG
jgi:exonuclease SbcD